MTDETKSNVVNIEDFRALEDVAKIRLGATSVVFAAVLPDGSMMTFIPDEIWDINLVYIIQTLSDRRKERLQ